MQYSSDEISVDSDHQNHDSRGLKYLPHWPAVNIEFQDLVYTVPDISGKSIFFKNSIQLIGKSMNNCNRRILSLMIFSLVADIEKFNTMAN